ncbi:hypothetical protein MLD38_004340 [Melastoma candidum]|uniref:Uncharacterized protein n=1 Tax=Melastoma candidum TaxID=119954 RepID=A0ACB9S6X0_9MYRT|nr:hypothetical protein MLD38_004340 [Melastoma candidum]
MPVITRLAIVEIQGINKREKMRKNDTDAAGNDYRHRTDGQLSCCASEPPQLIHETKENSLGWESMEVNKNGDLRELTEEVGETGEELPTLQRVKVRRRHRGGWRGSSRGKCAEGGGHAF